MGRRTDASVSDPVDRDMPEWRWWSVSRRVAEVVGAAPLQLATLVLLGTAVLTGILQVEELTIPRTESIFETPDVPLWRMPLNIAVGIVLWVALHAVGAAMVVEVARGDRASLARSAGLGLRHGLVPQLAALAAAFVGLVMFVVPGLVVLATRFGAGAVAILEELPTRAAWTRAAELAPSRRPLVLGLASCSWILRILLLQVASPAIAAAIWRLDALDTPVATVLADVPYALSTSVASVLDGMIAGALVVCAVAPRDEGAQLARTFE